MMTLRDPTAQVTLACSSSAAEAQAEKSIAVARQDPADHHILAVSIFNPP
jgi:hypothetical protein